ncbi:MAG: NupC/NupG family nucleoside CNT transporter, partial [Elusimicrobiaceae bacterium]|nr:NupC/NupG family nucleoside CNT transporter [Elusimicrobiaceae bacterium]
LGEKTVLNEFVAYLNFAEIMKDPGAMSAKTGLILSYALCGFANFLSIGIQIAGIGGIAPSRRKDIAALGLRAMIAGFMANNLRTAIAALLIFM